MANPSKQKGTGEETRIVRAWNEYFGRDLARRTAASSTFDVLVQDGSPVFEPLEVLVTRADRGGALYTVREGEFLRLFRDYALRAHTPVHIESKRYKKFSLHTIFEKKFGGTK